MHPETGLSEAAAADAGLGRWARVGSGILVIGMASSLVALASTWPAWASITGLVTAATLAVAGVGCVALVIAILAADGRFLPGPKRAIRCLAAIPRWGRIRAIAALVVVWVSLALLIVTSGGFQGTDGHGHYWLDVHGSQVATTRDVYEAALAAMTRMCAAVALAAFALAHGLYSARLNAQTAAAAGRLPAAGWYADPEAPTYRLRNWDGQAWTDQHYPPPRGD